MKDLIMISNYSDTLDKQETLRNLVSQINLQKEYFDILIVSHTTIPQDIQEKCHYSIYDYKNELIYDWEFRDFQYFYPENSGTIQSIFTGEYNKQLAIWRMIILGNSFAKGLGYNKIHHIEFDSSINNFSELIENSKLLDTYNTIFYVNNKDVLNDVLFGSYQAYRLDNLPKDLLVLNEPYLKNQIRHSTNKTPEVMLQQLLKLSENYYVKSKSDLLQDNNFGLTHGKLASTNTAWCLPFYNRDLDKLEFVVWNMEHTNDVINVRLIYNNKQLINIGDIPKNNWKIITIDDYKNVESLTVILNNKIKSEFSFKENKEKFKKFSFK